MHESPVFTAYVHLNTCLHSVGMTTSIPTGLAAYLGSPVGRPTENSEEPLRLQALGEDKISDKG
jgi:hypothetical protein